MPQTQKYGFPYEHVEDDQPGITLHGGTSGTEDILAEEVEKEVERIDDDLLNVNNRVSTIEDTGLPGWTYITHGQDVPGGSLTLDVTDNGRFAPGAFAMLRLHMRVSLTEAGLLRLRINGNSDGVHNTALIAQDALGTAYDVVEHGASQGSFMIGYMATVGTNNVICQLFNTNIEAAVSYQSTSTRMSASANSHAFSTGWGNRTSSIGPTTSIRIHAGALTGGSPDLASTWWWLEGFKLP